MNKTILVSLLLLSSVTCKSQIGMLTAAKIAKSYHCDFPIPDGWAIVYDKPTDQYFVETPLYSFPTYLFDQGSTGIWAFLLKKDSEGCKTKCEAKYLLYKYLENEKQEANRINRLQRIEYAKPSPNRRTERRNEP